MTVRNAKHCNLSWPGVAVESGGTLLHLCPGHPDEDGTVPWNRDARDKPAHDNRRLTAIGRDKQCSAACRSPMPRGSTY